MCNKLIENGEKMKSARAISYRYCQRRKYKSSIYVLVRCIVFIYSHIHARFHTKVKALKNDEWDIWYKLDAF